MEKENKKITYREYLDTIKMIEMGFREAGVPVHVWDSAIFNYDKSVEIIENGKRI